jgi:hypothetical protein
MKRIFTLAFFLLMTQFIISQIVINELDSDTSTIDTNIDTLEFIELKATPNFALDGYVVVFFNGSSSGADSSYLAIDLDGYTTDINGLLLIGSTNVSPIPQLLIFQDMIQNGADAVGVYLGNDTDFPEGTLATTTNLIDALAYDTSDADDTVLMGLLGLTEQINEGVAQNVNSIQRNNDGSYTVKTPTPRKLNDGSGIVLNGISFTIAQTQYNEGQSFDIVFTTEQNVTAASTINFTLNNGGFTTSDFTGNLSPVIPIGQNTITTTITLIDDILDEGDEVLKVSFGPLPSDFLKLKDNVEIRVVDDDFVVAAWGIPTNPSHGLVSSTQPSGYYDSLYGLSDVALRQALQDIVANPSVVRAQTYADIIDILKEADQNPANSNQVWLVYTEQGRAKLDYQLTSSNLGKWNREHTFPRSLAGYNSIVLDEIADGKNVFWTTKADSLRHGNSDGHALRAADGPENSARNNQHYGEYNGPTGTLGSFKGDVARSVLYMAVRYNGLEVVNGYPSVVGQMGDLATLLTWHRNDPPDDFEMNRNNVVYTWQFNRNPFIDQPDLVEYIWGNKVGQTLGVNDEKLLEISVYPNPTKDKIFISGIKTQAFVEIYSTVGRRILRTTLSNDTSVDLNVASGIYFLKIVSDGKSAVKKIVVK